MIGNLTWVPAAGRPDLLAAPVARALEERALKEHGDAQVAEIDPELADTAAFCERYDVPVAASANCVIVAGRRGGEIRYAACMVLATRRADVNGVVRRRLDARKTSFAPMDQATALTGMEYGGITPLGLPGDWPILVDEEVCREPYVVIGSGVRRSKLLLPSRALAGLPSAEVLPLAL
jgi:prolyl-tRNA editing enzyme YbaK/EbsC (Cys-tRNA(Pro) deacylase)